MSRNVAVLSCVAAVMAVARDVAIVPHYVAVVSHVAALWVLGVTADVGVVFSDTVLS